MSRRTSSFSLLAILVSLALLAFSPLVQLGHAGPAPFALFGSTSGWGLSPSTIDSPGPSLTVAPGQAVDLSLTSSDGNPHNWGVDYNGNGAIDSAEPLSNTFTTTDTFPFVATNTPGTYTYWCFIHKPLGFMFGSFIVQATTPDFTIGADPQTIGPLNPDVQGTSAITITPLNGFTGDVQLIAAPSAGLTAAVNPDTILGGSGTSTLTASASTSGSYSATVTGSSGTLSHSVAITVNIVGPDFSITAAPTLTVTQGSSTVLDVSLQSLEGFSGDVNLTATVSPSGPVVSTNPERVTLSQGATGVVTVTVSTVGGIYSSVTTGSYTIIVTGNSGPKSHSVQVALAVTPPNSPGAVNFPAAYLAIGILAAAALAMTIFLVQRRRSSK